MRIVHFIVTALAIASLTAASHYSAQADSPTAWTGHPVTDVDKITDALRAGPSFITEHATVMDWPAAPGGEYRVLRPGSSQWTCLPGVPGYSHDEPGCFDPTFFAWIKDSLAGKEPHVDAVGISYMYVGAWVPNESLTHTRHSDFHVGPHLMIVSPHEHQSELEAFSRDGSTGDPYVAHLPNGHDLYLVILIREWPRQ